MFVNRYNLNPNVKYCRNQADDKLYEIEAENEIIDETLIKQIVDLGKFQAAKFRKCKICTPFPEILDHGTESSSTLVFDDCEFLVPLSEALKNSSFVTTLIITDIELNKADIQAIAQLPNLKSIMLTGCHLTDELFDNVLFSSAVQTLSFAGDRLPGKFLKSFRNCRDMKKVSVNLSKLTDACIPYLSEFSNLNSFDCEEAEITNQAIESILHCSKLKSLNIMHTQTTNEILLRLHELDSLEKLAISFDLDQTDCRALQAIESLKELTVIGKHSEKRREQIQKKLESVFIDFHEREW